MSSLLISRQLKIKLIIMLMIDFHEFRAHDKLGVNEEKCNNFIIEFGNSEKWFFFFNFYCISQAQRSTVGWQLWNNEKKLMRSNAMMRWKDGKNIYKKGALNRFTIFVRVNVNIHCHIVLKNEMSVMYVLMPCLVSHFSC